MIYKELGFVAFSVEIVVSDFPRGMKTEAVLFTGEDNATLNHKFLSMGFKNRGKREH